MKLPAAVLVAALGLICGTAYAADSGNSMQSGSSMSNSSMSNPNSMSSGQMSAMTKKPVPKKKKTGATTGNAMSSSGDQINTPAKPH